VALTEVSLHGVVLHGGGPTEVSLHGGVLHGGGPAGGVAARSGLPMISRLLKADGCHA
jgi:hypothetical protein